MATAQASAASAVGTPTPLCGPDPAAREPGSVAWVTQFPTLNA
jgi:hypothetical protein